MGNKDIFHFSIAAEMISDCISRAQAKTLDLAHQENALAWYSIKLAEMRPQRCSSCCICRQFLAQWRRICLTAVERLVLRVITPTTGRVTSASSLRTASCAWPPPTSLLKTVNNVLVLSCLLHWWDWDCIRKAECLWKVFWLRNCHNDYCWLLPANWRHR